MINKYYFSYITRAFRFLFMFCFLLQSAGEALASYVYKLPAKTIKEKEMTYDFAVENLYTLAYYDLDALELGMDEGDSFSEFNGSALVRYGYGKYLELKAEGRVRSLISTSDTTARNVSRLGGESLYLGAKFMISEATDPWKISLDFGYRLKTFTNQDSDAIILGDDANEILAGLHLGTDLNFGSFLNLFIAYKAYDNYLSPEILYNVELAKGFSRLVLLAGVKGSYSLSSDAYTQDVAGRPVFLQGVTTRYNAKNPGEVRAFAGFKYQLKSFILNYQFGLSVYGLNTDKVMSNMLSISFVKESKKSTYKTKNSKFKEYFLESSVIKVSPRGKFVQIDQGISVDIEVGMRFDIFKTDYFGGNVLIASGEVIKIAFDSSIIKIVSKYKSIIIEKGFLARGY